ncbi:hypothetical protein F511_42647 [Dorcoceras hygrometricum]|uniref:Uncharacterized protein n=1 Tax=Dorcoceras hygrometricum TaxID=472368 RepID=A0A2Z7AEV2_9LAMI|nr:hypothetical protein F511_42647 [Dorcoceras hygrometricum]
MPELPAAAKGKTPLQERDPIKGNPSKEIFSLICANIEFQKDGRAENRRYLCEGGIGLTWGETDSTRIVLQRRMFIFTKYRELLFRKLLETRTTNFVPGQPSSAIDLKVLNMLSNLHLFVIEELKTQMQSHGLQWELPYCSILFEGKNRDRGAVLTRSNTHFKSSCWIRTMIRVNDSWVIKPCADYWQKIPKQIVPSTIAISPQLSYVDTLPTVSEFFKLLKKRWADVCIEASDFFASGKLLPVGSLNFCRALAVVDEDKKGEVSSIHGRGKPPDDQSRPSGGSASRSGGDASSRRSDDIRGSSTKRGSSSGGGGSGTAGGPYKKNVEWWLYGKNQF